MGGGSVTPGVGIGGRATYPNSALPGGNYGSGFGMPSGPINGLITGPQLGKEWLLPGVIGGQNMIGQNMPNAGDYVNQGIGYGNQASNSYAANQAQQMQQYMPQYAQQMNNTYASGQAAQQNAYNTALAAAPGMNGLLGSRNALLQQQTQEASGQAPQYLQDYWKQQAGGQLQGTMGAFGNSSLGAGSLANMMAANLYQYHTGAEQNLGNTINNWNPYMNQVGQNTTANTLASAYAPQGSANAWQGGFGMGQSAYNNATQPIQNASKWFSA